MHPFDLPVTLRPGPDADAGAGLDLAVPRPPSVAALPGLPSLPDAAQARTLMDNAQTGLYVVQDGLIAYANPALAVLLGWPAAAALAGKPHLVTMAPEFHDHAQRSLQRRLEGRQGRPGEVRCLRRDGQAFDARVLARRVDFQERAAVLVTVLDISELKTALRRAEWHAGMLERTEALCGAGSFETELTSGRTQLSAGLVQMLALAPDARNDLLAALRWVPPDERAYVAGIWANAVAGEPFEFQHRVLRADGARLVVLHRGLVDARGRGVALLQDVTARVEAAQRIQQLATHHEVTKLPNRAWLLDQVDAALHAARWQDGQRGFALLAIDVPRIAEVKGNMGFGAGDALSLALAARLRALGDFGRSKGANAVDSGSRADTAITDNGAGDGIHNADGGGHGTPAAHDAGAATEWVAHLGDTEFAVLLHTECGTDADALRTRALALQHALQQPVRLGTTDVYPQCRIGIATFPADGDTSAQLLERAQTARLDVAGGQGVAFFRLASTQRALREMQIESALWQALERSEFELHYQPQVDLASGTVQGAEALLRWQSPELGQVSPGEFIPVAERSGLIGAIGDWVLEQACRQIGAWRRAGLRTLRIGVNLASSQLQQPDLAGRVQTLLLKHGADPAWLGVELTESMVMADVDGAAATLRAIKAIGVEISLDDFGTGFSSLSYLARLPLDVVKVDRSFVHDVTAHAHDVSVTRAIIHMTHGLQMRALAEGVETEGQLSLLVAAGCDEFQGYWFSRPVPAAAFEALVRAGKRLPDRHVRGSGRPRQRTLLLVDDEALVLQALHGLLQGDGMRIITATSAEDGLRCLADGGVDVIISDQRMPGMTGVEFLRRAKELYPHTLRMVLSGFTELQSIIDAVNEGAIYKFLTKPWDGERLRAHVAEAFQQKELGDENRRLARQIDGANADLAALNERLERTLNQQREQAELLATSAGSMRQVFDDMPVPVLGLDNDGLLAFVNREAERRLPLLSGLLGSCAAHHLPADVMVPVAPGAPPARRPLLLEGQRFDVLTQGLPGSGALRGCLLLLLPVTPEHE